ncbi:MAG TPA: MlaD family protein [Polyangiaceae bacterium LLY-WYZ-15_(1-7)]|nr:organic solvent ABC transporter substrate-binding protein [Sandaracinus sp.]HJL03356.1 MlaD family protein [Polyangiaceae bacterium LLY-WYZ-15_(1-7)]HJL10625.1 MlaD family protein [Polyangiaceae bacterium LLY-WYZ-15_(1-7)]HJL24704.1 MlaD family protein [Polyangiaceae bacterium LLY-WYZ-15_(1-7)]HJL30204.1 MlaD family protein [Polyangiaceae bacterium LLY-WYZ-15_(1-7)]
MRETWKAARVGLMVLLGVGALIAIFRYVDEQSQAGEGYRVYALFDDAQGLIEKSRVVIAGIPVGYIDRIGLEGAKARVDIVINADVELHEDATVAMRAVSLLGEQILAINPGSTREPLMEDGDRLRVASESVGTDDVLHTVNEIAENVSAVTAQLERSFGTDEAGDRMEAALLNLSEALEGVNRTIQANEQVVGRTLENIETTTDQGGPRLVAALENIEQITSDLRGVIHERRPDIDRTVGEVDDTVASIRRASEQLEGVLADARVVTDRTARGEGTIGRLTSDDTLIEEAEGAIEGVNNLVGGLARLQTIVELRSEYNFLANTFKTYFSLRLAPREGRYFLIQLVDDPRGSISTTQTTVRRSPPLPDEPREYQETRVTRSDALRFTIQLAKRISFATFRFGIMESTGGLGLDLHVFDDRLELNTDIFAIGVQTFPRLRARLAFEIVNRLWVVAGVDDALNDSADFFMGLQIRFNDQDLRSLLPFLGGALSGG